MSKKIKNFGIDEPMRHPDHPRPITRRQFVSQGFGCGAAAVVGGSAMGLLSTGAHGQLSDYMTDHILEFGCGPGSVNKIPFICFDLAGGSSMANSNVLIGGRDGQLDILSSTGYARQGLPADMAPGAAGENTRNDFGLLFHNDSMFFTGMMERAPGAAANTNGVAFAARSENDTGNNPHNPLYAINRVGANGELLPLIGSRTSESGGNSMAPMNHINPQVRPTKVDRASDLTGLVDAGELVEILGKADANVVMESMYRLTNAKLKGLRTGLNATPQGAEISTDQLAREIVRCGYLDAARVSDVFDEPLDPREDGGIVGDAGIFSEEEYDGDREFRKTAAVMKMVVNRFAGAGCITMGGYDYHGGGRITGDTRDLRAGRCIGACLEYARRLQTPLCIYVFSDGSLSSNGQIDDSPRQTDGNGRITDPGGGGKFMWSSDNQQTAGSFMLCYDPIARPEMNTNQIGWMRENGTVETDGSWPGANNVPLLCEAVALNYMAMHGMTNDRFNELFGNGLGVGASLSDLRAFNTIASINNTDFSGA